MDGAKVAYNDNYFGTSEKKYGNNYNVPYTSLRSPRQE